MNQETKIRYHLLDQIRGLAVVLMIIFHLAYDLSFFGYYDMNYPANPYWYALPRIIVFLFLICVGMGLYEAHYPLIKIKKFNKRLLLIVMWAIVISISTYFMFPERWIYFGTLHCIAFASLASLPFLRFPKTSLIIGSALVISDFIFGLRLPWIELNHKAMDYIPFFPWWGFALIGIFVAKRGWHKLKMPSAPPIEWLGKHALAIYVLHQPILFGLIYLIYKLQNS